MKPATMAGFEFLSGWQDYCRAKQSTGAAALSAAVILRVGDLKSNHFQISPLRGLFVPPQPRRSKLRRCRTGTKKPTAKAVGLI
jgi:hypothetical protein